MPLDTCYGYPRAGWDEAKRQAEDVLTGCARSRGTITYAGLCDAVSAVRLRPYSFAMAAFLDEICAEEDAAHGIVLASLVVRKDTGMPGEGYFGQAAGTGRDVTDRRAMWEREVARVYAAYGVDADERTDG